MNRKTFALLVGIDNYASAFVGNLQGCANDIGHFETFLRVRGGEGVEMATLLNEKATRAAVIDKFENFLTQAGEDDTVLFYYSGHGAQQATSPEFLHLEPDGLDEMLVLHDSMTGNTYGLADKELTWLINRVAQKNPHIVVILDCCHSGSGTRGEDEEEKVQDGVTIRRVATNRQVRPLNTYLFSPTEIEKISHSDNEWFRLPAGRHVVLSACLPEETAKERNFENERRGAFSYYLLEALQRGQGNMTYRDIVKRVAARVQTSVRQTPQIEVNRREDLHKPFLGGGIVARPPYFTVNYLDGRWQIDGGAVHGIASIDPKAPKETTQLAIFEDGASAEELATLDKAIDIVPITKVQPNRCEIGAFASADKTKSYLAIVVGQPLKPLRVAFSPAREVDSPFVVVSELEDAEYAVSADSGGIYRVHRTGDNNPLAVHGNTFEEVLRILEHITRWQHTSKLDNPNSKLRDVKLEIISVDQEMHVSEDAVTTFDYKHIDDEWQIPAFRIRVTNNSSQKVYCMVFDITDQYGVVSLPLGSAWLKPDEETYVSVDGDPDLDAYIPEHLRAQKVTSITDTIKLIVCTDECDPTLLEQEDLQTYVERGGGSFKSMGEYNTLNRLMLRVHDTRAVGRSDQRDKFIDWTTLERKIKINWSLDDGIILTNATSSTGYARLLRSTK